MTKKKTLAQTPKLETIVLADGKEYRLKPMNANLLCDIEDYFDQPITQLLVGGRIKPMRYLLWLRLKDNYDITEERVGELFDANVMDNIKDILGV